jgi:5-(carboxyamino)imidazole ribonucleotide synthase
VLKTVGVIGGGQLARMMIAPAIALGLEIKVLAETDDSPAKLAATMVGDYTDYATVAAFARTVDVITFDHEHVPLDILERLEQDGVLVHPASSALEFAQNKLHMRRKLTELGLPLPAWAAVHSAADLDDFIAEHGGVAILKTPTGGYDGKGVRVVRSSSDAADWLERGQVLLVEEKVNFVRELAQLSARNHDGHWQAWPVVQTIQANGVCSEVLAPAPNVNQVEAAKIAKAIAEGLGVTGVLAVELFETEDGTLLVNELAMRPHNSGHFSIEGSVTSQFEQHIRAVANLPLGDTALVAKFAVMVNLLGVDEANTFIEHFSESLELSGVHLHTYGKQPRVGRKMGHITVLSDVSMEDARQRALQAKQALHA